jgi:hypothetical protein
MALDASLVKAALLYPWNDGDSGTTLVGGGILTLLSPLLVPGLLVLGYTLRVVETSMSGDNEPPVFDAWPELLVDGLKGAIVLLIVVALPLIAGFGVMVFLLGLAGFRFDGGLAGVTGPGATGGLALLGGLLLGGLALMVLYVAPAALVLLARTGRLRAALAVDDISRLARSDAYGSVWLLALGVMGAATVVLGVLNAVGVGLVLSGFVSFYALVSVGYLFANGAAAAGFDVPPDTVDGEPASPEG